MMLQSVLAFLHKATPLLADHLWQSTLFALVAASLTLVFRKNQARVRSAIWLAASIKFLVPFALLASLGSHLPLLHRAVQAQSGAYTVVEQVSAPFSSTAPVKSASQLSHLLTQLPSALAALWFFGSLAVLVFWCLRWRQVAAALHNATPLAAGREFEAMHRMQKTRPLQKPIPLLQCSTSMEPGIFGILRPALVWPQGFSEHLSDAQLNAILAHELWHVRRRDNLAAALHMLVEAAFWFHPLVWWIGTKLVEERERACDEHVLQLGNPPEIYAESILKACEFCLQSPLACVSGVAGSSPNSSKLKERIVRIMNRQSTQNLTLSRKLMLAALGSAAIAGPIAFGLFHAPQVEAQPAPRSIMLLPPFESTSIKSSVETGGEKMKVELGPDNFSFSNATVKDLIKFAYGVEDYQVVGAPTWSESDKYDVAAKWKPLPNSMSRNAGPPPPPPPPPLAGAPVIMQDVSLSPHLPSANMMLQQLLTERFNLKLRHESRDLPTYDLVVASTGPRLTPTATVPPPPSFGGERIISVRSMFKAGNGEISITNAPVDALTGFLTEQFGRQVVNKTGIKGSYDMTVKWTPGDNAADSVTAAIQDQLGLTVEPQHGPVKVLVVNQVDKPSEN